MATPTYTPIASITLGSSASSVEFSSIPQDYRDLVLVQNATYTGATSQTLDVTVNSDTGSNYSVVFAGGDGSSTASNSFTDAHFFSLISDDLSTVIYNFMDYSATDKHKTLLSRISDPLSSSNRAVSMLAQRYASTNAITTIKLDPFSDSIAAGSTFALYGIEA